jgi:sulfatase modifying factor 1
MKRNLPLSTCAIVAALITSASATVTMDWVTIGDINNAADPLTGYGAVDHAYRIGKYEVTNAQYGEFLNAKGQSNDYGIYNSNMPTYGITQSGVSGNFSYTVTTALANRPVVLVSWFDAVRFANWMTNGQGNADMETGAYSLNGAASGIIFANAEAKFHIPSQDEWYKAAYYNAVNAAYSLYPNGRDTISEADANYGGSVGSSTDVGSYSDDASSYGTLDQSGNVWEWNDATSSDSDTPRLLGGAYDMCMATGGPPPSSYRHAINEYEESVGIPSYGNVGFRLASVVPEPTSIVLTMLASGMMFIRRKR